MIVRGQVFCPVFLDPVGGVKGYTWGPSSVQKDRHQRSSVIFADGRWSHSAPNLEKTLRNMSGHSNIGPLKEFCAYNQSFVILYCRKNQCRTVLTSDFFVLHWFKIHCWFLL